MGIQSAAGSVVSSSTYTSNVAFILGEHQNSNPTQSPSNTLSMGAYYGETHLTQTSLDHVRNLVNGLNQETDIDLANHPGKGLGRRKAHGAELSHNKDTQFQDAAQSLEYILSIMGDDSENLASTGGAQHIMDALAQASDLLGQLANQFQPEEASESPISGNYALLMGT